MRAFVLELRAQLESELNKVSADSNAVKGYDRCIVLVLAYIRQLKQYVATDPFPDKAAEIHFFKHEAPYFYCKHTYFVALHNAEVKRITLDEDDFRHYLEDEKERIRNYFKKFHVLHYYYHSGREHRDGWYTRGHPKNKADYASLATDENHCRASLLTGKLLGFEQYRRFIKDELNKPDPQRTPLHPLLWRNSKAAAVELIVALSESASVEMNNEPAQLVQIKEQFERAFNIDLKDFDVIDYNNRARKKSPNAFLEKLQAHNSSRNERLL